MGYQSLLGQLETTPGHVYWGQIVDTDGTILLCLHQWAAHEHPTLMSPDEGIPGNGLIWFFRVDDYELALKSGTRFCRPIRRGATREPKHSNMGVLAL